MYAELQTFLRCAVRDRALWRDGEFSTSLVSTAVVFAWLSWDPTRVQAIRNHFPDFLTIVGIVFGFVLTSLLFYVQVASNWSQNAAIQRIADKVVDRHVWTVLCLWSLLSVTAVVWSLAAYMNPSHMGTRAVYAGILGLAIYSGLQVLNHTLTVWWTFQRRSVLASGGRRRK